MKRRLILQIASVVALTGMPAVANAQHQEGVYGSIAGGVHQPLNYTLHGTTQTKFDWGWAVGGALGYAFGNGLRAEGELGYRAADVDKISGFPGASGDMSAWSVMANVLYDIRLHESRFVPYVGAGFGAVRLKFNGVEPVLGSRVNDKDWGPAFQGIAGAAYEFTDRLALTADYRFLFAPNMKFNTDAGDRVKDDFGTHQVMLGLRYLFWPVTPPPPPPPVTPAVTPAPEPAPPAPPPATREFLVFFDWDSTALSPETRDIIRNAAETAKKVGFTRINLTGHTDTSGSAAYNLGLSERRAEAVKAELVRLGIAANEITTVGRGQTDLLVPTGDEVREPQNRRVQIVID